MKTNRFIEISLGNIVSLGIFPLQPHFTGKNLHKQLGVTVLGEEGRDKIPPPFQKVKNSPRGGFCHCLKIDRKGPQKPRSQKTRINLLAYEQFASGWA
jgi:hypothetical protein